MRHVTLPGAALLSLALFSGCAGVAKTVFLDEDANFGAVRRVALLPLENLTGSPNAAEKVSQILAIELLRARAFELVETNAVLRALAEARVEAVAGMTPEQTKAVGEALEAQALFHGSVREMDVDRSAGVAAPVVSLQFELLDAASGKTLWSAVVSRHGAGAAARLFGVGETSTNEAIQKLVREALRTLIK